MKILILSTSNKGGGAFKAANRIHKAILKFKVDSKMLVQDKIGNDDNVIGMTRYNKLSLLRRKIDKIPLKLFKRNEKVPWSLSWLPSSVVSRVNKINPDIVNLHWVCGGMMSIGEIGKIKKPVVWTLHDMWPFTGGFHYSNKYLEHDSSFISKAILKRKLKLWKDLDLTIVTVSSWLKNCAQKSQLFKNKRIEVIPNCLNINEFCPRDKKIARKMFDISLNKKVIVFGAINAINDKNKGFKYLIKALRILEKAKNKQDIELLVFGASGANINIELDIKITYLGRIEDNIRLSYIYSVADVVVIPSLFESFGQTGSESISCGTPVVAFDNSGLTDIVEHKKTGYLAKAFSSRELYNGIMWVINNNDNGVLSENSREKALREFSYDSVGEKYLKLYNEIISDIS